MDDLPDWLRETGATGAELELPDWLDDPDAGDHDIASTGDPAEVAVPRVSPAWVSAETVTETGHMAEPSTAGPANPEWRFPVFAVLGVLIIIAAVIAVLVVW